MKIQSTKNSEIWHTDRAWYINKGWNRKTEAFPSLRDKMKRWNLTVMYYIHMHALNKFYLDK